MSLFLAEGRAWSHMSVTPLLANESRSAEPRKPITCRQQERDMFVLGEE